MPSLGAPLMCWDIFMDAYTRSVDNARDIEAIHDMARRLQWKQLPDMRTKLRSRDVLVLVTTHTGKIVFAGYNSSIMTGYKPHELDGIGLEEMYKADMHAVQKKYGGTCPCTMEVEHMNNTAGLHTHDIIFMKKA